VKDELPVGINFLSRKYKMLLSYLLIYHYYPLEASVLCYIHLDLLEILKKTESFWLCVLLDKQNFLKYLEVQETMTLQQFFSGICNNKNIQQALDNIVLRFEEKLRKPKRIIRRKGYRDKGSLGNFDSKLRKQELENEFYFSLVQFEKEEKEALRSDYCTLLEEYLNEGRVLTDELLIEFKIKKGEKDERANSKTGT
jgi:hypothetical protein